jgi:hypothetical protein
MGGKSCKHTLLIFFPTDVVQQNLSLTSLRALYPVQPAAHAHHVKAFPLEDDLPHGFLAVVARALQRQATRQCRLKPAFSPIYGALFSNPESFAPKRGRVLGISPAVSCKGRFLVRAAQNAAVFWIPASVYR